MINKHFQEVITKATGAIAINKLEVIQKLWSGYGDIVRYELKGSDVKTVIVKHIQLTDKDHHPRGWNTDRSHQRKLKSYEVETAWYKHWGQHCDDHCRIPHSLAVESDREEIIIVLEDLDANGYPVRKENVSMSEVQICLSWLAHSHASFLGQHPDDLWPIGTYWHLDTRPDELEALKDIELKNAAKKIDQTLQSCTFQTIVHGDAKLANFCFSPDGHKVAAVDFQYVGGGCGMKDVAYFIGSCFYEDECERLEKQLLDFYFVELKNALIDNNTGVDPDAVEHEWRHLYPVAWTDFHRFIKGWSPGHWKIHGYSERIAHEVVTQLNNAIQKI